MTNGLNLLKRPARLPRRLSPSADALRQATGEMSAAMSEALGCKVSVSCLSVSRASTEDAGEDAVRGLVDPTGSAVSFAASEKAAAALAETVFGAAVDGRLSKGAAEAVLKEAGRTVESVDGLSADGPSEAPRLLAVYEATWRRKDEEVSARFVLECRTEAGPDMDASGALGPVGLPVEAIVGRLTLPVKTLRELAPGTKLALTGGNLDTIELTPRGSATPLGRGEMGKLNGARTIRLSA